MRKEEELGQESTPVTFERVSSPVVLELFDKVEQSSSIPLRLSPSKKYLSIDDLESTQVTFERVSSPEFIEKFRGIDASQTCVMVTDSDGNTRWFNVCGGTGASDLDELSAPNLTGEDIPKIESLDPWEHDLMLWNTSGGDLSLKQMAKQMSEFDDEYANHPFGRSFVDNLSPLSEEERIPPYKRPPSLRRFLYNLKVRLKSNFRVFIDRYTKPVVKRDEYQEDNVYLTSNGLEERLYGEKASPDLLKASEEAERLLFSSTGS